MEITQPRENHAEIRLNNGKVLILIENSSDGSLSITDADSIGMVIRADNIKIDFEKKGKKE